MTDYRDGGYVEEIGKIRDTHLGFEDHGMFSLCVDFDFGGSGQGFGHVCLVGEHGIDLIQAVLRACGVDRWESLKGRTLFVLREEPYGLIKGLKPLPFENGKGFVLTDEGVQKL